eukprot:4219382-Pyramimonas_sp.AAC.1
MQGFRLGRAAIGRGGGSTSAGCASVGPTSALGSTSTGEAVVLDPILVKDSVTACPANRTLSRDSLSNRR